MSTSENHVTPGAEAVGSGAGDGSNEFDAIVVGSGLGGLVTAAHLAAAGRKVVVLEHHDVAGGNCTVFRRGPHEFDVGFHYVGDCGPGGVIPSILGGLGLAERIEFTPLDPDGFDTLIFPDETFSVPADRAEYLERLQAAVPDDAAGLEMCIELFRQVAEDARNASIPGVETPTWDEWGRRPVAELYRHCGLGPRSVALLSHWNGLYGSGTEQAAVSMHAMMMDHYLRGAFYVEGGGQVIPARLVEVIEAHGGEVRCRSRVEQILVEDGAAVGVQLAGGEELQAPLVVSNADWKRTATDLVGAEHWRPETIQRANDTVMSLGLICTYVVVDVELPGPNTNYFVFGDWGLDNMFDDLEAGRLPNGEVDWVYVAMASRKDPGNQHLCPPGHTNFQIMTLAPRGYDWLGVPEGPASGARYRRIEAYRDAKARLEPQLVEVAERALGPFADHIVHIETATPVTHERYTLSSEGTSYGLRHDPDQTGRGRPSHSTEIDGLWLVGANTVSGHGIAGSLFGGVQCAGQILGKPLLIESMMGQSAVDPAALPTDLADWDPLEVSRGAALRDLRAEGRERRSGGAAPARGA